MLAGLRRNPAHCQPLHSKENRSKSQQDALLPAVEDGTVSLIGATTENPSFEINGALLSRARVLPLNPLTDADVQTILRRAVDDADRGLAAFRPHLDEAELANWRRLPAATPASP